MLYCKFILKKFLSAFFLTPRRDNRHRSSARWNLYSARWQKMLSQPDKITACSVQRAAALLTTATLTIFFKFRTVFSLATAGSSFVANGKIYAELRRYYSNHPQSLYISSKRIQVADEILHGDIYSSRNGGVRRAHKWLWTGFKTPFSSWTHLRPVRQAVCRQFHVILWKDLPVVLFLKLTQHRQNDFFLNSERQFSNYHLKLLRHCCYCSVE